MAKQAPTVSFNTQSITNDILSAVIEREREREIISRRYGLFDRKETLEQIGELLGITRERVRQLEKSVMTKLRLAAEQGKVPHIKDVQTRVVAALQELGGAARISDLSEKLVAQSGREERSRLAFLSELSPDLTLIEDDNDYYLSVAIKALYDEKQLKKLVAKLISTITKIGEAKPIEEIAEQAGIKDPNQAKALANTSKHLATLNGTWGLTRWPMVNPRNIRDKIYVILRQNGKHMHFNEIADAIKESDFKRKDVTTQAIHNELIKDNRFVLIGRGIYALKEWGYEKGTVADTINEVLRKANAPLHRDEIVKRVLKTRYVKETTVLLNLQGKPQFMRVAKATYTLAQPKPALKKK